MHLQGWSSEWLLLKAIIPTKAPFKASEPVLGLIITADCGNWVTAHLNLHTIPPLELLSVSAIKTHPALRPRCVRNLTEATIIKVNWIVYTREY